MSDNLEFRKYLREQMEKDFSSEFNRHQVLLSQAHSKPMPSRSRAELEAEYGKVWDEEEFEQDFWMHGYCSDSRILVRAKDLMDLDRYFICYQDEPRLYFYKQPT